MTLPFARGDAKPPSDPSKFFNGDGLSLRLQCFLVIRDADRRIACVRLKGSEGRWSLPGENVRPNEDLHEAARRVSQMWFGTDLQPRIADILTFPEENDDKRWYVLFLYEAQAPRGGLPKLDDTDEVAFVPAGKAPGEFGMDHASVFARLKP